MMDQMDDEDDVKQQAENPAADVMPEKLKAYLAQQQSTRPPMYASNDDNMATRTYDSIKNALKAPEAQAAKPDYKQLGQKPDDWANRFVKVNQGQAVPKHFYSKSQNKTKIVYPDGREELVDGYVQPK